MLGLRWSRVEDTLLILVFLTDLHFHLEYIVFEVAFLRSGVRKHHLAVAVLDATDPFSMVATPISPVHLSVPVSFIFLVLAFVDVTTGPLENSIAMFSVVEIVTLIAVALGTSSTSPLSFAFFHSSFEVADVAGTIGPSVLALPVRLSILVLARVRVSIYEYVRSGAVLKTEEPFSLVPITVLPGVDSISVCLALVPLADITVVEETTPDAVAVLESRVPLSIVDFAVDPSVDTLPICLPHLEVAIVRISVWVALKTLPVPQVFLPAAFILATIRILHDSSSVPFAVNHDS